MPGNERAAAYQLHSEICAEIAQQVADPETKLELLSIAQAWLRLAEQALKNEPPGMIHQPQDRGRGTLNILGRGVRDRIVRTVSA